MVTGTCRPPACHGRFPVGSAMFFIIRNPRFRRVRSLLLHVKDLAASLASILGRPRRANAVLKHPNTRHDRVTKCVVASAELLASNAHSSQIDSSLATMEQQQGTGSQHRRNVQFLSLGFFGIFLAFNTTQVPFLSLVSRSNLFISLGSHFNRL